MDEPDSKPEDEDDWSDEDFDDDETDDADESARAKMLNDKFTKNKAFGRNSMSFYRSRSGNRFRNFPFRSV